MLCETVIVTVLITVISYQTLKDRSNGGDLCIVEEPLFIQK